MNTLTTVGAIDSFVQIFMNDYDQLFDMLKERLVRSDDPLSKQVESSNGMLKYTDHNGCQWLFDSKKPYLGWG